MVYNEQQKQYHYKYLRANWEEKYKEYYQNKTYEWRENNPEEYKRYMRNLMNKRNAYKREVQKFMNILL